MENEKKEIHVGLTGQGTTSTIAKSLEFVSQFIGETEHPQSNKLTEENIKELQDTLGENLSPDSKLMRELTASGDNVYPYAAIKKDNLIKAEADVEIMPTGEMRIADNVINGKDVSLSEIIDNGAPEDVSDDKYEQVFKDFNLTESDMLNLISLCKKVKNGEKVSVYKNMPESIKQMVRRMAETTDIVVINTVAKQFLNFMMTQINIDHEVVNLQNALKKELNMPGLVDLYSDHLQEVMEVKLKEQADIIRKEDPNKADKIMETIEYFKDSYTLRRQKELLLNDKSIHNKLRKGLKRFDKLCLEMNYKHEKNTITMKDIYTVPPILDRKLDMEKYTYDHIRKFIILFYEVTKNMRPENVQEHTFMYYSVAHINFLDHIDITKSKFNQELLSNIEQVLDMIKEGEK